MTTKQPFIFIDRDDTIIYDIPYLSDPSRVELTPYARQGLLRMSGMGYKIAMVTNQSGVSRGYFTVEQLNAVFARVKELLGDARIDYIYYCPHSPADNCECRKPKTGMLEQACSEHEVDLGRSFVIGDSPGDINMGKSFGVRTIQINLKRRNKPDAGADYMVSDLLEAAELIERLEATGK